MIEAQAAGSKQDRKEVTVTATMTLKHQQQQHHGNAMPTTSNKDNKLKTTKKI